jgi:hypothetical protein
MTTPRVIAIRTYPQRGAPAVDHRVVVVTAQGLQGDRRKRAAVSLVGHDAPDTRANVVVDLPTSELEGLSGQVVRLGGALLAVEKTGTSCPGLSASVGVPGRVAVGDVVETVSGPVGSDDQHTEPGERHPGLRSESPRRLR